MHTNMDPEPAEPGVAPSSVDAPEALAVAALVPLVYQQLRQIARSQRRQVSSGETLRTTALINEAYMRMVDAGFQSRGHFLRCAAVAMRNILIDRARAQLTAKRGDGAIHVELEEAADFAVAEDAQLVAVNDALEALAKVQPRLVGVVECRFYAGYSEEETAEALGLSLRTVQRDWTLAKAWLRREMGAG